MLMICPGRFPPCYYLVWTAVICLLNFFLLLFTVPTTFQKGEQVFRVAMWQFDYNYLPPQVLHRVPGPYAPLLHFTVFRVPQS